MFTDPCPDYKIPFMLLAYELFKNASIFYRMALSSGYCTPIFIKEVCYPLTYCFTFTMNFILVKMATAFLIVSDDIDSR
jgi:hypothetical protein